MNKSKPSKYQELLATEVACGASIKDAAARVGCKVQTAYNLSCTSEFRSRVSAIRSEITAQAVGLITAGATQAASTLVSLLGEDNESRDRLNAAKAILASLGPITELAELRARIDRIESSQLKVHHG
jgi:hypothetical protein